MLLHWFFNRATLCVSAVFAVARYPSVYLSETFVYCIRVAEHILKLLSRPGNSIILVFWPRAPIPNSKENPFGGGLNTRVKNFLRLSTEITVYLGIGTRQAHGCYGMLIESHRWWIDIDSCQFRRPWVTLKSWKVGRECQIFQADLLNNVWPITTKVDRITHVG